MAGDNRKLKSSKNPNAGSGGGGLAQLIGGLIGGFGGGAAMPEVTGGEVVPLEGPPTVEGFYPETINPLQVKKPGFWKDFRSQGAASDNYQALTNQIKLGEYENALRQDMLRRRLAGETGQIALRGELDKALEGTRFGNDKTLAELKAENDLKLAREKAGFDFGVPEFGQFKALGSTPDYLTGLYKSKLAGFEKPALDNRKIEADILDSNIKRPTLAYMGVGANAMVNPATGQSYVNVPPLFEEPLPGKEGGLRNLNVGSGTGFSEKPGGIVGEVAAGAGNSITTNLIPKEEMPAFSGAFAAPVPIPPEHSFIPKFIPQTAKAVKNFVVGEEIPQMRPDPFIIPPTTTEPQGLLDKPLMMPTQPQGQSMLDRFRIMMKLRGVPGF